MQILLRNMVPLGQLDVISAEAKQDHIASINAGIFNLCGYSANHASYGVIEAGIDLASVDTEHVSFDPSNNSITLRLPYPEITSCRIEWIDQYDGSFTLCGTDWDTLRQLAQHDIMERFVDETIERGLLERAKFQATLLMGTFVSELTGRLVDIEFHDAEVSAEHPSSCQSPLPTGWVKDENGTWKRTG